jgi:hypothetical protein
MMKKKSSVLKYTHDTKFTWKLYLCQVISIIKIEQKIQISGKISSKKTRKLEDVVSLLKASSRQKKFE